MSLAMPVSPVAAARPRLGARRLLGGLFGRLAKLAWMALGALIMLAGVAIAPLPGPFGLPIAVVGLMIVLRNSYWAKRQFIRMQYARPNWVYPFRRLMRRRPEFAPVMWQQVLRMERLLLKPGGRFLARSRRQIRAGLRPRR